jgi:hypothetical protein
LVIAAWFQRPLAKRVAERIGQVKPTSSFANQQNLPLNAKLSAPNGAASAKPSLDIIDRLSDEVISSGFDNITLGRLLNECIDATSSVDAAVGFAAIIAKAKIARLRRSR